MCHVVACERFSRNYLTHRLVVEHPLHRLVSRSLAQHIELRQLSHRHAHLRSHLTQQHAHAPHSDKCLMQTEQRPKPKHGTQTRQRGAANSGHTACQHGRNSMGTPRGQEGGTALNEKRGRGAQHPDTRPVFFARERLQAPGRQEDDTTKTRKGHQEDERKTAAKGEQRS